LPSGLIGFLKSPSFSSATTCSHSCHQLYFIIHHEVVELCQNSREISFRERLKYAGNLNELAIPSWIKIKCNSLAFEGKKKKIVIAHRIKHIIVAVSQFVRHLYQNARALAVQAL